MEPGLVATLRVTTLLDELGVEYFIGGSMASIIHGVIRTTQDTDLVADLGIHHVPRFCRALESDFYVEPASVMDAVRRRACFNVIHLESMFKVDVYLRRDRRFDDAQFARRLRVDLTEDRAASPFVASPEDTVLAKLEWFRLGGEVSERQWDDVLGVMRLAGARLEIAYLKRWAATLGIEDLLDRAFAATAG